ncbi:Protein C14F11.6 [Aphelenchoides avenae]|nr:Protein C14F11.6 [Aphelenchus avenae]
MTTAPTVVKRVKATIESIEGCPDLKVIRPKAFPDDRGFFCESYNKDEWARELDFHEEFKQDNHSFSKFGVLRGLHVQPSMGKLVSVVSGKIFDVAVDIREGSPTFGKWYSVELDAESKTMFWLPPGFLHGFQCLSPEGAHVVYKCSATYDPKAEYGVDPFDKEIGVEWPITDPEKIIVSDRDREHKGLKDSPKQPLK